MWSCGFNLLMVKDISCLLKISLGILKATSLETSKYGFCFFVSKVVQRSIFGRLLAFPMFRGKRLWSSCKVFSFL